MLCINPVTWFAEARREQLDGRTINLYPEIFSGASAPLDISFRVNKHIVTSGRGTYSIADSRPLITHNHGRQISDPEVSIQQKQNFCARSFPRPYDTNLIR